MLLKAVREANPDNENICNAVQSTMLSLEAKLQRAHIPCGDQISGFNTEIRTDLLHPSTVVQPHPYATGGTERQVVSTKGGACES